MRKSGYTHYGGFYREGGLGGVRDRDDDDHYAASAQYVHLCRV